MDPHLEALARRLEDGLSWGPVDGDLFRLRLEREWRQRLALARELFGLEPGLLREELEYQLQDLWLLESRWAGAERWEWCAGVRDLRFRLEAQRRAL